MKIILPLIANWILLNNVTAQNFRVAANYEHLGGGGQSRTIVHTDESGAYILTSDRKFIKVSSDGKLLFEKKYDGPLADFRPDDAAYFGDQLVLFLSRFENKKSTFTVHAAPINKQTGELLGNPKVLTTLLLEGEKVDDIQISAKPGSSPDFLLIHLSRLPELSPVSHTMILVDKDLQGKKIDVEMPFTAKYFATLGILLTKANNLIFWGVRYQPHGKKSLYRLFVAQQFDINGKKMFDYQTTIESKYLLRGKVIEKENGEIVMGGVFKKDSLSDLGDGVCMVKYNPSTGRVINADFRDVSRQQLGWNYKKSEEKFVDDFTLQHFFYHPGEQAYFFLYEEAFTSTYTGKMYSSSSENRKYLLFIKLKEGKPAEGWIRGMPKVQIENVGHFDNSAWLTDLVRERFGFPRFSSSSTMVVNGKLILFINDHKENSMVTREDSKFTEMRDFWNSILFAVILDLKTGELFRKQVYDNKEDKKKMMPRLGRVYGNDIYIMRQSEKLGKSDEFALTRVTVN